MADLWHGGTSTFESAGDTEGTLIMRVISGTEEKSDLCAMIIDPDLVPLFLNVFEMAEALNDVDCAFETFTTAHLSVDQNLALAKVAVILANLKDAAKTVKE